MQHYWPPITIFSPSSLTFSSTLLYNTSTFLYITNFSSSSPKLNNIHTNHRFIIIWVWETSTISTFGLKSYDFFLIDKILHKIYLISLKLPLQKTPFLLEKKAKNRFNKWEELRFSKLIDMQFEETKILLNFYLSSLWFWERSKFVS